MDPPKREQTSLTDSYGRSANDETSCECVSSVACVSVHENKNAYGACGCVSLHLRLSSETYDPVDCRCFPSSGSIYSLPIATSTKTFSTCTFSTCKIHTTKPAKGEYNL